ncbi:hypothetical protein BLX88_10495, partial [Bacillus obstructivus]
ADDLQSGNRIVFMLVEKYGNIAIVQLINVVLAIVLNLIHDESFLNPFDRFTKFFNNGLSGVIAFNAQFG